MQCRLQRIIIGTSFSERTVVAMRIAHVSDLHLRVDGEPLRETVDTQSALAICIGHLAALDPRPDLVIVTGDVAHTARPADYQALREAFDRLPMPSYFVPGNVDDRNGMRMAFADGGYLPADGFLNYVIEAHPVRLIGLDTQKRGAIEGELCGARQTWLADRLAEEPERPTVLFMHHPPVDASGGLALEGADALERIVAGNSQVLMIACGHLHKRIDRPWAETVVTTAASVAFSRDDVPPSAPMVADACPIYTWMPEQGIAPAFPPSPVS